MLTRPSGNLTDWLRIRTKSLIPLLQSRDLLEDIHDRASLVPGCRPEIWRTTRVIAVGAGGINGEVLHILMRKGVQYIQIFDGDTVAPSNLNRQFFFLADVGQYKAHALIRNLAPHATEATTLQGYPVWFEDAVAAEVVEDADLAVVGVDSDQSRIFCARYFYQRQIPCVFLAVSKDADGGYCYVQESQPDTPCWLCRFPAAVDNHQVNECVGANIDSLKVVAGLAGYALDSLIMPQRPRQWHFKEVRLHGLETDGHHLAERWPDCPVCGGG